MKSRRIVRRGLGHGLSQVVHLRRRADAPARFPDIFDDVTRKSTGYTLNTNGTLITPEIAQLLKRQGTKMIALYGATAEVYDAVTRNPGGFDPAMRGFRTCRRRARASSCS